MTNFCKTNDSYYFDYYIELKNSKKARVRFYNQDKIEIINGYGFKFFSTDMIKIKKSIINYGGELDRNPLQNGVKSCNAI
jgi:hypothetical protein